MDNVIYLADRRKKTEAVPVKIKDKEWNTQIQRINKSLKKINRLMAELKQMSRKSHDF